MKHKLCALVGGLSISVFASGCVAGEGDIESEPEALGRTQQALCFLGPNPSVPSASTLASPGTRIRSNMIPPGNTYGNGPCDGFVAKVIDTSTATPHAYAYLEAGIVPNSKCASTRITVWMWTRYDNGSFVYRGSEEVIPQATPFGCMGVADVLYVGPSGRYEVNIKGQVRTQTSVTLSSGVVVSTFANHPVALEMN